MHSSTYCSQMIHRFHHHSRQMIHRFHHHSGGSHHSIDDPICIDQSHISTRYHRMLHRSQKIIIWKLSILSIIHLFFITVIIITHHHHYHQKFMSHGCSNTINFWLVTITIFHHKPVSHLWLHYNYKTVLS